MEKRRRVLDCLARATNDGNKTIEPLNEFALVTGDQTVKSFQSWHDWVDSFVGWLYAIRCGHKPSASFLIPHNDFGPDLVFAMRKTDKVKDKIVLCSIQVSTARLQLRPWSLNRTLSRVLRHNYSLTFSCLKLVEIGLGFDERYEQVLDIMGLWRQKDGERESADQTGGSGEE